MKPEAIQVRAACAGDVEFLCEFLHRYMDPSIAGKRFQNLFNYPWMADKPDLGFVLTDSGNIVGFLGTVYADREIDGQCVRFCNLSCWFVLPKYRNHSLRLLSAAQRQPNVTFTNLTSRPAVEKISLAMRYEVLSLYKLFSVPLAQAATLLRLPAARITLNREAIAARLDGGLRKLMADHAQTTCDHLLLEFAGHSCYIIWKRRVKQSVPFSEVLYVSDSELLRRHFELVKLRILIHDRTLLLAIDENLLRRRFRLMYAYRRITLFRSDRVGKHALDSLYSELTLF